jgi:eukaryotic-like serine/threonine-protein kinase
LRAIAGIGFDQCLWAPDGRGLFVEYRDVTAGFHHAQIGYVSYPGGEFRTITKDTSSYYSVALSAGGKTLATIQNRGFYTFFVIPAAGFDANAPAPAIAQVEKGFVSFAWLNGEQLTMVEDNRLVRASADGGNKTTLLNDSSIENVAVCPDGRTILLNLMGKDAIENANTWRISPNGADFKQLSKGRLELAMTCSRDSKWVYIADNNENLVKRVAVDGGAAETVPGTAVPHAVIGSHYLDISPDGKTLVFLVLAGESNPVPKIPLASLDAGTQLVVRFLNPNRAISDLGPLFTPDGKALVYPIRQNGVDNLWWQPLDGSAGRQITKFSSGWIQSFRWAPDGKTIGVLNERREHDVVLLADSGLGAR